MRAMERAESIVVDGTFEKCPHEFGNSGQMYNIRAYLGTEGVSLAHAFLPNRFKKTYLELFGQLKRLCQNVCRDVDWTKKLFLVDFEQGAIKAIQETFSGAKVKGCIFHFRQSLYRNLDSLVVSQAPSRDSSSETAGQSSYFRQLL
jgi:hypothetical protein